MEQVYFSIFFYFLKVGAGGWLSSPSTKKNLFSVKMMWGALVHKNKK